MRSTTVVLVEHTDGKVDPVTYEAVSLALRLKGPSDIVMMIVGDALEKPGQEIAQYTGLDVVALHALGLDGYNGHAYKEILGDALTELNPVFVIGTHTTRGAEYAPALAVKLGAACVTSVDGVSEEGDGVTFGRSIMGGKLRALIRSTTSRTVVTVQPGAFGRAEQGSSPGTVHMRTAAFPTDKSRRLGVKAGPGGDSNLTEAKTIIAAGRGVTRPESLELIHDLARHFPQSSVAGSRPLCDMGFLNYNRQVGLTGATVSPELYVAVGISGAQQHIVGMQGAGFVVAINTDPHAAIFNHADVCVVEDFESFIPELITKLQSVECSGADHV